jgi:hypothetical protein
VKKPAMETWSAFLLNVAANENQVAIRPQSSLLEWATGQI